MSLIKKAKKSEPKEAGKSSLAVAYATQRRNKRSAGAAPTPAKFEPIHHGSIAEQILRKKKDSGMADLEANAKEIVDPTYDELNREAVDGRAESEAEALDMSDHPEDSNMIGDELDDSEEYSMIDKIRAKIRAKRGM